jgi:hypothetical protein
MRLWMSWFAPLNNASHIIINDTLNAAARNTVIADVFVYGNQQSAWICCRAKLVFGLDRMIALTIGRLIRECEGKSIDLEAHSKIG